MAFQLIQMLPSLGQIFTSLINSRNGDKKLSHDNKAEERRLSLQRELADLDRQTQIEIAQGNVAFQVYRLEKEQELQRELAALNDQRQLEIANMQRDTALALPEVHKLFENWPLRNVPSHILNAHHNKHPRPLRVFISPPLVEFDKFIQFNQQITVESFPKLEKRLAESLRTLLNANYPQTSTERPTELLDGAWDSSRYFGGASMRALFHMLQSEPVVVLDSEVDGDVLNFRLAYWGLAQDTYTYQPVLSRFPYREVLYASAKARALKWKTEVRDKLLAKGKDLQEINDKYGSDNAPNLAILEEDAEMRADGIEIERHYRVNQEDWETLCQVLGAYHAVALGVIADGHFLLHHDTPPKFIECLADWLKPQLGLPAAHITEWVLARYEDMFQALATERAYRVPLLRLQLAAGLKDSPELAERQVVLAVREQFRGRMEVRDNIPLRDVISLVGKSAAAADADFLEILVGCLRMLNKTDLAKSLQQHATTARKLAETERTSFLEFDDSIYWRNHGEFMLNNGLALDSETQIMWLRFSYGQGWKNNKTGGQVVGKATKVSWENAFDVVKKFNQSGGYAGYSDWRLPSIEELQTLISEKKTEYHINLIFPGNECIFWSSSRNSLPEYKNKYACAFNLKTSSGFRGASCANSMKEHYFVLFVRDKPA